nr:hypothetical protein [Tanacetum cinerariifolium]
MRPHVAFGHLQEKHYDVPLLTHDMRTKRVPSKLCRDSRGNKRQDENQLTSDGETCIASDNRYVKKCDMDCGPGSSKVNVSTSSQGADVQPEQEHCKNSLFSFDAGTKNMESSSTQVQAGEHYQAVLGASCKKLFDALLKRPRPHLDDKLVVGLELLLRSHLVEIAEELSAQM